MTHPWVRFEAAHRVCGQDQVVLGLIRRECCRGEGPGSEVQGEAAHCVSGQDRKTNLRSDKQRDRGRSEGPGA